MAKKLILGLILVCLGPNSIHQKNVLWVLPLLGVIHCCRISLYSILRKTNEPNLRKWAKKTSFGPDFGPCEFHLYKMLEIVPSFH